MHKVLLFWNTSDVIEITTYIPTYRMRQAATTRSRLGLLLGLAALMPYFIPYLKFLHANL